jgi:hypothetical protein
MQIAEPERQLMVASGFIEFDSLFVFKSRFIKHVFGLIKTAKLEARIEIVVVEIDNAVIVHDCRIGIAFFFGFGSFGKGFVDFLTPL